MKYAILSFLAAGLTWVASAYPGVSTSTTVQLNQWTTQYSAALAKAAATGRPVMIAFVDQGGCSKCATWDKYTLSRSEWTDFLAANPMVLIWVDENLQSSYSPSWQTLINGNGGKWSQITAYPEIVILSASGNRVSQFIARNNLASAAAFISVVSQAIGGLSTTPVTTTPGTTTPGTTTSEGTFPAQGAGDYSGVLLDKADGTTVRGMLKMSATKTGRIAGKIAQGASTYSFTVSGVKSSSSDGSFSVTAEASRGGGTLSLAVDGDGWFSGEFNGARVSGRKSVSSDMSPFVGYYTATLGIQGEPQTADPVYNRPQGAGFLIMTVSSKGSVKYAGYLADGTKMSGAADLEVYDGSELAALGYAGGVSGRQYACFALYKSLYGRRGSVAGLIWFDSGTDVSGGGDNSVMISGSEWVYPGKSVTLTGDQFVADFDGGSVSRIGAYYAKGQDLASVYAGKTLYAGGVAVGDLVASGRAVKIDTGAQSSLKVSTRTGLVTGKLIDPVSGSAKVSYRGAFVPMMGVGAGFYLVPDSSVSGYVVKRSYAVRIDD